MIPFSMHEALLYQNLADAVLVLHFGVVVFVVAGLALVIAGNRLGWSWVNDFWLRLAHILAIGVVAVQAWLGKVCPLTTLESSLRVQAGAAPYDGAFIAHWTHRLLFYDAPPWIFTLAYTAFALLVAIAWRYYPPKRRAR